MENLIRFGDSSLNFCRGFIIKFFINFPWVYKIFIKFSWRALNWGGYPMLVKQLTPTNPTTFASFLTFFAFLAHDTLVTLAFTRRVHEHTHSRLHLLSNHLVIAQRVHSAYLQHLANIRHTRHTRIHSSLRFTTLLITRV